MVSLPSLIQIGKEILENSRGMGGGIEIFERQERNLVRGIKFSRPGKGELILAT